MTSPHRTITRALSSGVSSASLIFTASKYFNSQEAINDTKKQFSDKGIKITDLGASCELHFAAAEKRQKNLDEAKRHTDLAAKLGCPYIRVFPNKLPPDQDRIQTLELISQGLNSLGDYANGSGVRILMETHGDLIHSDDIVKVMSAVESPNTGLVWDIANMWSITKEPPAVVYEKLKKLHLSHPYQRRKVVRWKI